jgi:hypothetical protein
MIQPAKSAPIQPPGFTPKEWQDLLNFTGMTEAQLRVPGCAEACARLFFGERWRSGQPHPRKRRPNGRWRGMPTEEEVRDFYGEPKKARRHGPYKRRPYVPPAGEPRGRSSWPPRGNHMGTALHFRTLGVKPGTSVDEIKSAYRKLAMQFHPDRNPNGLEKMKDINKAYHAIVG